MNRRNCHVFRIGACFRGKQVRREQGIGKRIYLRIRGSQNRNPNEQLQSLRRGVLGCACFSEVFQHPGFYFARLDVRFGNDASQITQLSKSQVRTRSTTGKDGIIEARILGHDALDVGVDSTIHRSIKRLPRFDAAIEDPAPAAAFFHLSIWRLGPP